jgi:ribosome biogenesis GTPase
MAAMPTIAARILSHHGRQAWVMDEHGKKQLCVYNGREQQPVANAWVKIDAAVAPAVIMEIAPRANTLMRSEAHRTKLLAANIEQAVIVISGSPLFSDELLARMICACAAEGIGGAIVLNKVDLALETQMARTQLASFHQCLNLLGWPVFETAANPKQGERGADALAPLQQALEGKTSVVMGQSGMGKSSLLNALVPGFNAQTRDISLALNSGRHTTTAAQMVALENGWVIDTPGFQLFGLHHLSDSQLALGFPEWAQTQATHGRCRYANCSHIDEPGCSIKAAIDRDERPRRRLDIWKTILAKPVAH